MKPESRILFVRVGLHDSFTGPQNDNDWPKSFGEVDLHAEAFNFLNFGGTWYGSFGMSRKHLHLRKINPALPNDPPSVDGVLVVFVATCEDGERIVGWYREATVYDNSEPRVEYPVAVRDRFQNHFNTNGITTPNTFTYYLLEAQLYVPLSLEERTEGPLIPRGPGGFGQSNVCYPYTYDGNHRLRRKTSSPWIQDAVNFIKKIERRR